MHPDDDDASNSFVNDTDTTLKQVSNVDASSGIKSDSSRKI
jgi:hypothetical protein